MKTKINYLMRRKEPNHYFIEYFRIKQVVAKTDLNYANLLVAVILTISVLLFTSCASNYIPGVVNAPMLKNKGEIQSSVNGGTSSFSPKVAYAVSDNIGILMNGSFGHGNTSTPNTVINKHNYLEIGAGYFEPVSLNGIFEIYGGYGFGNIISSSTDWLIEEWNPEGQFINHRIFIQPSIGYHNKIVHFNFATKFGLTNISKNSINNTVFVVSPVGTLKIGFKQMKLVWQLGMSIRAFGSRQTTSLLDYNLFIINIGVEVDLFRDYQ